MGRIVLVTGGARSGKSRQAEEIAARLGSRIAYIATACAVDSEMEERIARHRAQRPASWRTFEEPIHPSWIVAKESSGFDAILLDCLTVMITNRILRHAINWEQPDIAELNVLEADVMAEANALIQETRKTRTTLIAVSNEVGCGIVPILPMARFFRDCAGRVNQRMAAAADGVVLVTAGIPFWIKGQEAPVADRA